ncbi:PDZ domain-containing protein [Streptomyces panaciradicis]|uniref:PDZ domain-containing protein n=1 Tax=Streptomyces panaciradicis TaxID=1470261 RepID=UPI00201CB3FA|nr:PDZ domain-containing protein [Streptomyces panaciradicis]MCL6672999.1 PDZ domain-containing protein [Streptomyces panaciradicis]
MEQTALRPKPMPGQDPGGGAAPGPTAPRPHAARRRARRLRTALFALFTGSLLVLSGVGLGAVGVTAIGTGRLADLQRQVRLPGGPAGAVRPAPSPHSAPAPYSAPAPRPAPDTASPAPAAPTLGVEAVDAEKAGALVVGVHVPGPGCTAGLVRGDVLLALDRTRIDSAADLARAVAHARPGARVTLTVRHRSGGYQQLTAVPGVVT